jgi:translocation protein SEC63
MLGRTLDLTEGVVEISQQRKWLDLSISAIRFAQCVAQALWVNSHSLEQLPYVSSEEAKNIMKSCKDVKTLGDFLRLPENEKKGLNGLSEEQRTEVARVCSILPHLKVETKLFVEEEEKDFLEDAYDDVPADKKPAAVEQVSGDNIYEQDLVTLRITLTRENVTEGATAPPVYAPYFPKTLRENWWVVLTDRPNKPEGDPKRTLANLNVHAFEKVSDQGRKVVHEVRFMAPQRAGEYEMELQILSDCYLGLDHVVAVPFTVLPASQLPEIKPHPEDLELDNEPTLFEQVMAANVDESSDEEDEEEEEEKKPAAQNAKAAPKAGAQGGKKQQMVVEDASDSEEEN